MQAFETLFTQYFQRIYRYALALTKNQQEAEDLTQQTFYKALKNIHSFRGQSDPATWLCSIAKKRIPEYPAQPQGTGGGPCLPGV